MSNPCTSRFVAPRGLAVCVLLAALAAGCTDATPEDTTQTGNTQVTSCAVVADCPAPANPCDEPVCAADHTCATKPRVEAAACSDGNGCTTGETCKAGACVGGTARVCDDADACTADSCEPDSGACLFAPSAGHCNDGNPCTADACTAGKCVSTASKGFCDDGDACTVMDLCAATKCTPGSARTCNDGNPCTDDSCAAATGCTATNNKVPCQDGNPCTTGDACLDGACRKGTGALVCDDKNPCTTDVCLAAKGCTPTPTSGPCDDGSACTADDACAAGACVAGATKVCNDANPCTDDLCDAAKGCTTLPNQATCTDASVCTEGDLCQGGACVGGKAKACGDANPCTSETCDPVAGCLIAAAATPCDDANACTTGDFCADKACQGGGAVACDDKNPCTDDSCDKVKGCQHASNIAPCNDGSACTEADACLAGICAAGKAKNCDDANACTKDSCDPVKGCETAAAADVCDDGNPCTTGDACANSACKAGAATACDDKNPCTDDSCDAKLGCVKTNNTAPCDDGNAATTADKCAGGACGGALPPPAPTCEDFCAKVAVACTGANVQYANPGECISYCKNEGKIPAGATTDKSGNTIGCRTYHAGLAAVSSSNAASHCPHAGKSGGNVCGTWCENYCGLSAANCQGGQSLYVSADACAQKCASVPADGKPDAFSGGSVQCLIYHLGVAGKNQTSATEHCPHGSWLPPAGTPCAPAPPPEAKTHKVTTAGFVFSPSELTIAVGDSVEFSPKAFHSATQVSQATYEANGKTPLPGGFDVDNTASPASLKVEIVKFSQAGVIYFVCTPHAAGGMKGKITVK